MPCNYTSPGAGDLVPLSNGLVVGVVLAPGLTETALGLVGEVEVSAAVVPVHADRLHAVHRGVIAATFVNAEEVMDAEGLDPYAGTGTVPVRTLGVDDHVVGECGLGT